MNNQPTISFEYFPPRTPEGEKKLPAVTAALAQCKPEFFSVTYGAGGSTKEGTSRTVFEIKDAGYTAVPHLSFGGASTEFIVDLLNRYKEHGINRLVALRGDLPSGMGPASNFYYASELVKFVRQHTGDHFYIEVAAYPEIHPQAKSYATDIKFFKEKVDAGANGAITQYFYNADAYFYFLEKCKKAGVDIPIVPGIMPITNYTRLARFSDNCGAEIPRWICKQLEAYGDDSNSIIDFGIDIVTSLCERLLAGGAPGIHFYTLNKAEPSMTICKNLGFK